MKATPDDVIAVADLVLELCGIYLDESKGYLVENRLAPMARRLGCNSFAELAALVRRGAEPRLRGELIDAMSTNETLFFRDSSPFEALQHKVLPELIDAKAKTPLPRRLRIWSAACSTGQEPYSLAMTLCELLPNIHAWDITIFGTDISNKAIAQASAGLYDRYEIARGLSPKMLEKYFRPAGDRWQVSDSLRALVRFERLNLLTLSGTPGNYDIIFCRNVAIYFTPQAKRQLFLQLARCLSPGGYLFVGSSESLSDLGPQFRPQHHCRAVYYQPNLAAPAFPSDPPRATPAATPIAKANL